MDLLPPRTGTTATVFIFYNLHKIINLILTLIDNDESINPHIKHVFSVLLYSNQQQ